MLGSDLEILWVNSRHPIKSCQASSPTHELTRLSGSDLDPPWVTLYVAIFAQVKVSVTKTVGRIYMKHDLCLRQKTYPSTISAKFGKKKKNLIRIYDNIKC